MKNMVCQFWEEREVAAPTDPVPFFVHEQDRQTIRDNIIEAVIQAPDPIRFVPIPVMCIISAGWLDN